MLPVRPAGFAVRDKRSRASFSCKSLVVATALAVGSLVPVPIGASTIDVPVSVRQLSGFEVGTSAKRFGKLEFIGGMVMSAPEKLFGAMSSIRFRPDGEEFVSVLDTGHWLTGRVTRDATGALSGLEDVRITAMLDAGGREPTRKMEVDAEGLALRAGKVFVSYEQRHRIDIYPDPGFETAKPLGRLPHLIPITSCAIMAAWRLWRYRRPIRHLPGLLWWWLKKASIRMATFSPPYWKAL